MDYLKDHLYKCVICDSNQIAFWTRKKSRDGNLFSIYRCLSCKSGFLNPRPQSEYLKKIYKHSGHGLKEPLSFVEVLNSEKEYPNSTVDAMRMIFRATEFIEKRITNSALDIGSGFGFYSNVALKADFKPTAVNPGEWENDIFEAMNGFRPINKYIEDLDFSDRFDLIIMSQVLEHIDQIERLLLKIREWLTSSGVMVIAVPNVNSLLVKLLGVRENGCLWVPEHLNYFSKIGLFRLLQRTGYYIVEYEAVSRIPYNCLSRRLHLKGIKRRLCNVFIKTIQKLPLQLATRLGYGLYHNIWIKKG